ERNRIGPILKLELRLSGARDRLARMPAQSGTPLVELPGVRVGDVKDGIGQLQMHADRELHPGCRLLAEAVAERTENRELIRRTIALTLGDQPSCTLLRITRCRARTNQSRSGWNPSSKRSQGGTMDVIAPDSLNLVEGATTLATLGTSTSSHGQVIGAKLVCS